MLTPPTPTAIVFPKIDYDPPAVDSDRTVLDELPSFDPNAFAGGQIDLRSKDLSNLDLYGRLDDLLYADFNTHTIWPTSLPPEYDPAQIMELGKNPGLGVRALHEQGITGRGVGIGIVDTMLLVTHQEFRDQLRLYEETEEIAGKWWADLHGTGVASIAVGRTVGVAPDADLYFIGTSLGYEHGPDYAFVAQGVNRILAINAQLPEDRKIRVISLSMSWDERMTGYEEIEAAVAAAREAGILVVYSHVELPYPAGFTGLGRNPLTDPDAFESYGYALLMGDEEYDGIRLLVPMDSRTTASPTGDDDYAFYRAGGLSWSSPYLAGVYALAAQVDPTITPERFWELAQRTGRIIKLERGGTLVEFGPILDPQALIAALNA